MSNTKHTPGPWQVTTSMSGARSVSQSADLYSIALLEKWRPEYEANAKLIAAAPELLNAAKMAIQYLSKVNSGDEGDQAWQYLESAIKKATE